MIIYTQLCGLVIISMLLFFYYKQPTMGLASEQLFKISLLSILISTLLDIFSCNLIIRAASYGESAVYMTCKLYLVSVETVVFTCLSYAIAETLLNYGSRVQKLYGVIVQILFLLGCGLTLFLPIETYYDGRIVYTYGPAVIITFVISGLYIIGVFASCHLLKKYIKPKKATAIRIWMVIMAAAAIIQYYNPKHLIVSFAACIGALVVFFEIENPESSISRRTGHFSSAVIREYLDHLYQNKKEFSLMMISFTTVADSSSDTFLLRKTIAKLSDFLFSIKDAKVFDTTEGYFLLVFDNTDFMESTKFRIATYFQSIEDSPDVRNAITLLRPYYTIVPTCNIADNSDELLMVLSGFIPSDHKTIVSNEIVVNSQVMADVRKRKMVENLVVDAMKEERVEVFYQPIFDINKEKFTSAEALVRIRLSDGTLVMPDQFIPIVEETGRIIPLSDVIYRSALSFIKSYRIENLGIDHIELNLSIKQSESDVFASRFQEQIDKFEVDPSIINLEITDTSHISNLDALTSNMRKLINAGIQFSIDDFGSGTSNLNFIIDMPINIIKLGKHLTSEYFDSTKARLVVETVVEMAHSMGLKIVAEGIETYDEVEAMKALGIDYIQGYYFSKPLPEHEFLKFLQNHNL
ncbi:MAG: EAL domain-containing protein [Pseudobutyrivibrio sp.]|nr:EAL domain-containing protein [Pseudobutyrivibrio sp.]